MAPKPHSPQGASSSENRFRRATSETSQFDDRELNRDRTSTPSSQLGRYNTRATLKLATPVPTQTYLAQSARPPEALDCPQPQLIVLDLNGTLIHRPDRRKGPNSFITRPFVDAFLQYLLDNFTVMVWSSATPYSVKKMCGRLFDPAQRSRLVAEWGRDTLGLTPEQYREKVQVYKQLASVWSAPVIRASHPDYTIDKDGLWDQSNTILVDDSVIKASSEPYNLVQIPEFEALPDQMKSDVLRQVVGYLEEIRYQKDVSAFVRQKPFRVDGGWDWIWPEEATKQTVRPPARAARSESVLTGDTGAFDCEDWLRLAASPQRHESSQQQGESQHRRFLGEVVLQKAASKGNGGKQKLDPVEHKRIEKIRASIPGLTTLPPDEE